MMELPDGIAYQNKDVLFKILSEHYKNKSFEVYGLDLPPIKEVLPTNLPAIQLDERRSDNIFLLEGNTILILEYESDASEKNLIKYGHYAFRVTEVYSKNILYKLVIVVIYTGDIQSAPSMLDLGCMQLQVNQVFLSKFDGNKLYNEIADKIHNKLPLNDKDVMQFIILPLTQVGNRQDFIENAVNLAKEINDEDMQSFIIAGILSASDKFIDKEYSSKVKEWLRMTKVGRLFEEEKLEYANEYASKYANEKLAEAAKEAAKAMLEDSVDILTIMKATKLGKAEILKLKNNFIEA